MTNSGQSASVNRRNKLKQKEHTMAEETHELEEFVGPNHDDMSVLNYLLQTIKGISSVAGGPMDLALAEDDAEY